jgi:hypothetical protein
MALRLGDGYYDEMGDVEGLEMGDAELIDDLADVGALPRGYGRGGRRGGGGRGGYGAMARGGRIPRPNVMPGKAMAARRLIPMVPGAPAVGLRLQPLGFPVIAFTAASGTALPSTSRPQRPFKGKRLVVDIARTGVSATGLVTVTEISIGTNNQEVSRNPVGANSFSPLAYDTNMELAACTTALDITIGYAVSAAPANADRIDIATTLFGEAVG